jgi:hypothetical protein
MEVTHMGEEKRYGEVWWTDVDIDTFIGDSTDDADEKLKHLDKESALVLMEDDLKDVMIEAGWEVFRNFMYEILDGDRCRRCASRLYTDEKTVEGYCKNCAEVVKNA